MEQQIEQTKGVTLTQKEAEEFCAYKRQKKISEITLAMRRSECVLAGTNDVARELHRAARLRQAAVRVTPLELLHYRELLLKSGVKIDCVVGGNGETLPKVKAYEMKRALRLGAKEITAVLAHSAVAQSRYQELRKELKLLKRRAGKAVLKVRVERAYPQATLSRLARLCGECGVNYFSLPNFNGCQKMVAEGLGGCLVEITGAETLSDFKQMTGAGMGRIVSNHAWEIYEAWLKEAEKIVLEGQISLPKHSDAPQQAGTPPASPVTSRATVSFNGTGKTPSVSSVRAVLPALPAPALSDKK